MSQPSGAAPRLPWIVAASLAVVVAVLAVGFIHVHTASRNHARNPSGSGYDLTAEQNAAMNAAAIEATNVVTFSRKTFDADFQRALDGATGSLKSDLSGEKATTQTTLTSGKFDLKGIVAAKAFEGVSGKSILVLVTVNGYKVADTSSENQTQVQRLELTMVKSGKLWLASNLQASGIQ